MKRRELLSASALSTFAASVGALASAATRTAPRTASRPIDGPAPRLDLSTDAARLDAYLRMSGSTDGAILCNYLKSTYFGTVEGRLVPFHGLDAVVFSRLEKLPDGLWLATTLETAYRTDLDNCQVITRWRNPVTGETVDVPPWNFAPVRQRITPSLAHLRDEHIPGRTDTHRVLAVEQRGEDVVVSTQAMIDVSRELSPAPFVYNELLSLTASARDLARRGLSHVPTMVVYNSLATRWRPWMGMGDRPGQFVGNGIGRYGVSIADLPPAWLAETERLHPKLLKDPAAALAGA